MDINNMNLSLIYLPVVDATEILQGLNTQSSTGNDISKGLFIILDIVFNCGFIPILSLLGIVGNIINMMVLCRHGFKETTNIILVSLSLNDFSYSLLHPFCRMIRFIAYVDPPLSVTVTTFINIYVYPVIDIFLGLSFLHVTAIAIERFVAVFFPFYVSRIFTPYRVKIMLTFLYIYSIGFIAPLFFNSTYEWLYDTDYNATVARLVNTQFYLDNYDTFNLYLGVILNNCFSTVTLAMILMCSLAIIVKLRADRATIRRSLSLSSHSTNSNKNLKVVKMLLVVCLVNVTAFLPSAVLDTCRRYAMMEYFSGNISYLITNVNESLYQFNASANFFIYVTMSSKFEKSVRGMMICTRSKQ